MCSGGMSTMYLCGFYAFGLTFLFLLSSPDGPSFFFMKDYCSVQHSSNEFGSVFTYRNNCLTQKRSKKVKEKISFPPLLVFLTAFVLRLLQPKNQFTPTPARIFSCPPHVFRLSSELWFSAVVCPLKGYIC